MIARISMMYIIYICMPIETRNGVIQFGFGVMVLVFIIAYIARLISLMRYRLVLISNAKHFIIQEQLLFMKRQKTFTNPIEISCRQLGRGMPRMIFVKSLKSNLECFFGAPLHKDEQDNIVRNIQHETAV